MEMNSDTLTITDLTKSEVAAITVWLQTRNLPVSDFNIISVFILQPQSVLEKLIQELPV